MTAANADAAWRRAVADAPPGPCRAAQPSRKPSRQLSAKSPPEAEAGAEAEAAAAAPEPEPGPPHDEATAAAGYPAVARVARLFGDGRWCDGTVLPFATSDCCRSRQGCSISTRTGVHKNLGDDSMAPS